MKELKVLCILSTLLGNKATARLFEDAIRAIPGANVTTLFLGLEDYHRYPAPRWARLSNPWHSRYIARKKSEPLLKDSFDLLAVNNWESVISFSDVAKRIPSVALMDSVPATVHEQLVRRGERGLKRSVSHFVHHRSFKGAAKRFAFFFPMGSDCRDALVEHYGVEESRCCITLAPQDLERWKAAEPTPSEKFRLLFVGNDFLRKGGRFLISLFDEHLSRRCSMTIVSNDPVFNSMPLPAGVSLLRGKTKDDLLQIYQQSDLFVFPTTQDYMPQVLAEALTAGLPVAATDVGGIRDLVRNGENGILFPFGTSNQEWARAILAVLNDTEIHGRFRAAARRFAEEMLGQQRFGSAVRNGIETALGPIRLNGVQT